MKLSGIFHNTYKESPYKLELESQNVLARAGFIKKGDNGDYGFGALGTIFYERLQTRLLNFFVESGYSPFLGSSPELFFQGDVKSFRHLGKSLVGIYSHTDGEIWPKVGFAECRNRTEMTAMRLVNDLELSQKEIQAIKTEFCNRFDFDVARLDNAIDSGNEGFATSLYYQHPLGSGTYFECSHCGEKLTGNAFAAPRKVQTDELKDLEEVHTPDIRTIQQLEDFFSMKGDVFLKTILVEISGAYHAILLKGDRELNLFKLSRLLGVHESCIRLADKTGFAEAMGVEAGFIGPVGLKNIKIIADDEVMQAVNLICGGNKNDYHIKNVNPGRDYKVHLSGDLKTLEAEDICSKCGQAGLQIQTGFKLAQFVSGPADGIHTKQPIRYIDQSGKEATAFAVKAWFDMNRIVAMVADEAETEGGLLFKDCMAPFDYIITLINPTDEIQASVAAKIHAELNACGYKTLLDDTDERAGVKFSNADLTGVSKRITVGKVAAEGIVEFKDRKADTSEKVTLEELMTSIKLSK